MLVRTALFASLLGCSVLACQSSTAPAPDQAAAPVAVAEAAKPAEPVKVAAAEPAKHEAEEGCIYADADKKEHAEDEAGCPHGGGHGSAESGEPGHFGAAFALKETRALGPILAAGK